MELPELVQSASKFSPTSFAGLTACTVLAVPASVPSAIIDRTGQVTEIRLRETNQGQWMEEFRFPEPQSALVEEPLTEPRRTLIELGETAGLEPSFEDQGRLASLALPR